MQTNQIYPKITVVTPSFNQGEFIEKTILSVINQGYPNLEYIIIDGGSTDNSVEIIKKYENHLSYWVSEKDNGQSDALNKGFAKATGDLLCWINSDDYFLPDAFKIMSSHDWKDNVGAVVGIGHILNLNNEIIYTPNYYLPITTRSLFNWCDGKDFMQPSCFFSKKAWETCGPFNTDLFFCMDVDFWIKVSKKFTIEGIDKEIAHAYSHEKAKTTAEEDKMRLETYLMISSHGGLKEARIGLTNFYNKFSMVRLNSLDVVERFSLKKIIKLVFKKIQFLVTNKQKQ